MMWDLNILVALNQKAIEEWQDKDKEEEKVVCECRRPADLLAGAAK